MRDVTGSDRPLELRVAEVDETEGGSQRGGGLPMVQRLPGRPESGGFNSKYTFDSFVIGSSNRFAHAAALAVAEAPAQAYNPLFIYGSTGLGKTHLLHAVAQYVSEHSSSLSVRYVTSEAFVNDFINSPVGTGTVTVSGSAISGQRVDPKGVCQYSGSFAPDGWHASGTYTCPWDVNLGGRAQRRPWSAVIGAGHP